MPPPARARRTWLGLESLVRARGRAWMALASPRAALLAACAVLLLLLGAPPAAALVAAPLATPDPCRAAAFLLVLGPWVLLGGCSVSLL